MRCKGQACDAMRIGPVGALMAFTVMLLLALTSGTARADLVSLCGTTLDEDTIVRDVVEELTADCTITMEGSATLRLHNVEISDGGNGFDLSIEEDLGQDSSLLVSASAFSLANLSVTLDNRIRVNRTEVTAETILLDARSVVLANSNLEIDSDAALQAERLRILNSEIESSGEIEIAGGEALLMVGNDLARRTAFSVIINNGTEGTANIFANRLRAQGVEVTVGRARLLGNNLIGVEDLSFEAARAVVRLNRFASLADIRLESAGAFDVRRNVFVSRGGASVSGAPCPFRNNVDRTIDGIDTSGCTL